MNPKPRAGRGDRIMPKHAWTRDAVTGDYVLVVDGKERGRIPDPEPTYRTSGPAKLGEWFMELGDLQKEFERLVGCDDEPA
jgi:hypothetical protein